MGEYGQMQDWQEVKQGVRQGSVHGLMFFNIFINDLFLQIKTAQYIRKYTSNTGAVVFEQPISCQVNLHM